MCMGTKRANYKYRLLSRTILCISGAKRFHKLRNCVMGQVASKSNIDEADDHKHKQQDQEPSVTSVKSV